MEEFLSTGESSKKNPCHINNWLLTTVNYSFKDKLSLLVEAKKTNNSDIGIHKTTLNLR